MNDVTLIIDRIRGGDARATDELLPIVYNELRRMAGRKLDAELGHPTIQTTELVHEAYLRLVGTDQSWDCRALSGSSRRSDAADSCRESETPRAHQAWRGPPARRPS